MLKETYRGVDTDMSKIAVKLQGQIPFFFFFYSQMIVKLYSSQSKEIIME